MGPHGKSYFQRNSKRQGTLKSIPFRFSAKLQFPTCSGDWDLELACFGFY